MTKSSKRTWEPMQLKHVGHVGQIIQGGGGKLSLTGGDPGESRKEKPH
jgi:hypothetical protein